MVILITKAGRIKKEKDNDADDDDDDDDNTMMMKMMTTTTNDLPINKKYREIKKFSCSHRTKGISDKRPRCPEVGLGIRKPTSGHQELRSLNDRGVQKSA